MFSPTRELVARLLGYTSIGCWLCAQFPQVLKNARLQSCEGLALPFLVNWLFGDITNLIGCILTDQLPFQTYLAGYFCVVDFCLLWQYFHYRALHPAPPPSISYEYAASPRQSLILPVHPHPHPHPHPHSPAKARGRSTSTAAHSHVNAQAGPSRPSARRGPSFVTPDIEVTSPRADFGTIYEAARDVSRAADLFGGVGTGPNGGSGVRRSYSASQIRKNGRHATQMPDVDEDGPMIESFHSEMSGHTAGSGMSEGAGAGAGAGMSMSTSALDGRGRTLRRGGEGTLTAAQSLEEVIEGLPSEGGQGVPVEMREARSKSRSLSLVRGSGGRGKGRRAAGVAFMSLTLLLARSTITSPPASSSFPSGLVLSQPPYRQPTTARHPLPLSTFSSTAATVDSSFILSFEPHLPESSIDYEHVIGRISAWTCTTLYLTSRLPQIWKNFERKSVEGLSILLFVFAFAGNLSYVLSILLDPSGDGNSDDAPHYLLEALPYLLGSGGTLLFDLTIMIQSVIYGEAPPVPTTPSVGGRRPLFRRRLRHLEEGRGKSVSVGSERQPLLSGPGQGQGQGHGQIGSSLRERSLSADVLAHRPRGHSLTRQHGALIAEAAVG